MNRILTVVFILFLAIGFYACKHEVIELPTPVFVAPCDTFVSFKESVAPILYANCNGCHYDQSKYPNKPSLWFLNSNPTSGDDVIHANLLLIGGDKIKAALNGVIPPPSNLSVMPPGGKLDTCSIAIIEDWITAGMQE